MKEDEVEILFEKKYISANSILQLKDGKLLFFFSNGGNNIIFYSQKTFQKIYELELDKLIKKLEEDEKIEFDEEEDDDKKPLNRFRFFRKFSGNFGGQIIIKETKNDLILIGFNKYLIEFNAHENIYSSKVVKKFNKKIKDIAIISDEKLIIIAKDNIKEVIKEKEKY